MATILLTWELGGGMGHVIPLRILAEELTRRGHRVTAALKNLVTASSTFHDTGIRLLQAPFKHSTSPDEIHPPAGFAELLHNVGFNNPHTLHALVDAWRAISETVQPDIMICDHSPTALLGGWMLQIPRVQIGTGFFCPPPTDPLPAFPSESSPYYSPPSASKADSNAVVLDVVNQVMERYGHAPMPRLADLYDVDLTLLITYAELDIYDRPEPVDYFGIWANPCGIPPRWPDADGKRIFAYLKRHTALEPILSALRDLKQTTLIFSSEIPRSITAKYACPHILFEEQPVDITQTAAYADLAILNGTPASTMQFLRSGVPSLQLPLYLEQYLFVRRIVDMKAGLMIRQTRPDQLANTINQALRRDDLRQSAQQFAQRYCDYDMPAAVHAAADRIEKLLD